MDKSTKTTPKTFEDFTNLYEISKTLRFELKPVGGTEEMLKENKVFEKDEVVAEDYKKAKKYFDKLHREFIEETLKSSNIEPSFFKKYEEAFFVWKESKKASDRKALESVAKKLRTEILMQFEKVAENWRDNYAKGVENKKLQEKILKLKKMDIFFKVEVFGLLKKKYPEAVIDKKSIFDGFNKFSTYFTGFHQTRANFYKDDGTSTAIPTRIINENLPKFLENKRIFEDKYKGKCENLFTNKEKSIFLIEYFNDCLTQEGIEKYNTLVAGLRSKINEKRQKAENKNNFPFFKTLFKQILAEETKNKDKESTFIEIVSDKEVFEVLKKFIGENEKWVPKAKKLFKKLIEDQQKNTGEFDISQVYIAGRFINQISNKWFADWNAIRVLFIEGEKKKLPEFVSLQKLKEKIKSVEQKDFKGTDNENYIEKQNFFRNNYKDIYNESDDYYKIFLKIWEREFDEKFIGNNLKGKDKIFGYNKELELVQGMINSDKNYTNKIGLLRDGKEKGERQKEIIKYYAEAALSIYQMMKYFSLEKGKEQNWNPEGLDTDSDFYNAFGEYYENINTWEYFNEFRNYLTKKPYSEDKIKLNFESGNLLGGWPDSPEGNTQYKGFIFRRDGKYYLGVTNYTHIFDKIKHPQAYVISENYYEKMLYKQLDSKTIYGSVYKGIFNSKYSEDKENFSDKELINRIKKVLQKKVKDFPDLQFFIKSINNKKYSKANKLATDIAKLNLYKISFVKVNSEYTECGIYKIGKKEEEKNLYLFEIYNKDFAEKAKGKKKLHTLYWEEIFSDENRENPVIKLNGQAEIFFRKASLDKEKQIEKRNFLRDIVAKKRYTEDKIFFHCPLTLNFTNDGLKKDKEIYKGKADAFSIRVREMLAENKEVNVIGIDRGEKHLAYYSVVNNKGEILDIGSFNNINGTDYHKKLDELEKERDKNRKSWQTIGKIKDMKRGYVSQVVKKICDLMIDNNAIIVFEDLNVGFKRGRFAIEKQVYQNLELALAKKLNYLTLKDKKRGEYGHHTKAYQLTPKIDNFKDIYKQCGFMFYIPASYTSAICPICGFRKNIPTPTGTLEKNKEFIEKFKIFYETDKGRFRFEYEWDKMTKDKEKKDRKNKNFCLFKKDVLQNKFTFYSDVERLQFKRNKDNRGGEMKWRYPNEELKRIFEKEKIKLAGNLVDQIKKQKFVNKDFYEPLIYNIRLILQLRNAITEKDKDGKVIEAESHDFIQCPACHFHSEKDLKGLDKKYKGKGKLKFNGDANGAYNIARKGGLVIEKISQFKNKYKDLSIMQNQDLTITQEEWDKFAQK